MRSTIVINQSMTGNNPFTANLTNIGFVPRKIIIRQIVYANIAGADIGTYLLYCSLTGGYVGAIYLGIQALSSFPETIIELASCQPNVQFRLDPGHSSFATPTGLLTLTLECISE